MASTSARNGGSIDTTATSARLGSGSVRRTLGVVAALGVVLAGPLMLAGCSSDDDSAPDSASATTAPVDSGSGTDSGSEDGTVSGSPDDIDLESSPEDVAATIEQYYPGVPADEAEAAAAETCDDIRNNLLMDDLVAGVIERFSGDGRPDPTTEQAEEILAIVRMKLDSCVGQ